MKSAIEENTIVVKLADGEILFDALKKAASKHGASSGCVLFGVGQLRDFELGYFDGKAYERKAFSDPYELVGLHGTITLSSDPPLHVHAALSKDDYVLIGGHLFKATVATTAEVCLQKFSRLQMRRDVDSRTGLKALTLK